MVYSKQAQQKVIGNYLKKAMREKGYKPGILAEKTGINVRTIYSILNGHQMGGPEKLKALCSVLHLSIDELYNSSLSGHPIFSNPFEESRSYAHFEDIWFGDEGGERISVSRNFSIMNQTVEMRKEVLENIYELDGAALETSLESFIERKKIIKKKEKRRLEIVVDSEIKALIERKPPFNRISEHHINTMLSSIIERIQNDGLSFELIIIPRERFVVNYQILNRNAILFDLGTMFFRQQNRVILDHFLAEVNEFRTKYRIFSTIDEQIKFLKGKY